MVRPAYHLYPIPLPQSTLVGKQWPTYAFSSFLSGSKKPTSLASETTREGLVLGGGSTSPSLSNDSETLSLKGFQRVPRSNLQPGVWPKRIDSSESFFTSTVSKTNTLPSFFCSRVDRQTPAQDTGSAPVIMFRTFKTSLLLEGPCHWTLEFPFHYLAR